MTRHMNYIRLLILAIFLLTLVDAACTATGVSLGFILEGNPIMQVPMHEHPVFYGGACMPLCGGASGPGRQVQLTVAVIFCRCWLWYS